MNPIVLLHGALGASSQLESLAMQLRAAGRTVHTLNFSGHAGEPFSDHGFGIEVFADDLLRYLNQHQLKQVDIFGYSMGGYVALWLANTQPTRVGKMVTLGTKFDWSIESAEKEVKKMNAEKIEEKVPAFARLLQQRHAPNDWKVLLHKTAQMMQALGTKPLLTEQILPSIKHSVTILLGDQDDMADRSYSQQVAQWLPSGEFQLLPNTPHPIEKVNLPLVLSHLQ